MSLAAVAALLGCVRFGGMPEMPPDSAGDPKVYRSDKLGFNKHVFDARILVRMQNVSWMLTGTEGEKLAGAAEIRE
eukprot:1717724-Prymnesium_polylepis.1